MDLKPGSALFKLLKRIALTAGFFAFILCVLVIVNFYQLKRTDPLNSPAMKVLINRMNNNPEDEQVKQEIRELDLLARKAYFTSQWQIKTGGYLLVFSVLIVIICLKTIELLKARAPEIPGTKEDRFWDDRLLNRKWIAYSGLALVAVSLVFAYFSHNQLGNQLNRAIDGSQNIEGKESPDGGQANSQVAGLVGGDSVLTADSSANGSLTGFPTQQEINANFPGFRGPGGNGVVFQKNFPTAWDGKSGKNIRWKTLVPLPGYNSPVVWNDKIFLTGASAGKREVYCFDANTGQIRWTAKVEAIAGSPSQAPRVNGETGFAAPTVTTDGRRVYAIFANGDLIALDMDGKKVWAKNLGLPKNHYGHSSSLIMYRDLLIVQYDQSGNAAVMAFNAGNGEQVWKTTRNVKVSWSSPILVNTGSRYELILVAEPYMISYSPSTGKELWQIECISGEVGPSAAYSNGIAFSVNDYSKLAAVKTGNPPTLLWENDEYLSDIPSPLATPSYLFLPTSYGTMVCYDAKNGEKYWEHDFGNPTFASPVLADGRVYQLDKKGIMHIFHTDKNWSLIAEPQLGEGSACTPAFANGRIYIRGDKHLFCISK